MSINLTDELLAKTKKGKIASAKQVFLEGDQENLQQIGEKTHQLEDAIKDITVSGGASTATAVSYNNETSGMTAITAQGAIDELAAKNQEQDTAIGTKAEKSEVATELDKKFDKENIAQEFGDSEDKVVSQFALPFREIESPEFIKAIVDAEDHFLFGIQLDGSVEWGKGVPAPIRQRIQEVMNYVGDEFASLSDKIESIKLELSGSLQTYQQTTDATLANLQETKVNKEEGKSLIEDEVKECFRIIENEEFIMAVVDSEDRVLFGFYRETGKPYYPLNDMYYVIQNKEYFAAWIDSDNKVLLGIRRDGEIIGEIHAVNVIKETIKKIQKDIQDDISSLRDEVGVIDTNLKELLDIFSLQENPEYMAVEKDADGRVLSATYNDGSHYSHNLKSETIDAKVDKKEGKSLIDADVADAHSTLEDPEGRTEITLDADGKVMSYRDSEGKKHEHDIEVTNLDVSNLNLQGNSINNIQEALKANGFDVKTPIDWSESSFIQIPEPHFAIINVSNIDSMPTTKTQNKKAFLEFWDMQGNYFKKHAILNAQGRSSMSFPKKNIAIDLCDDEWVGNATPKLRIGDWVPQDSFHMKANYTDFFRGVGTVTYKLYEEIVNTRGVFEDRPWKKALIDIDKIGTSTKSIGNPYVGNFNLLTDTGALCFPEGFPVACYLNGLFYGIFTWQLKKHRDNYHMNKATAEHVHLDGIINKDYFWGGTIDWSQFEVRNPKNLYAIGGNKYDADIKQEEIAGDAEVKAWIALGKLPDDTVISSKIKKNLQLTAKVKKYILAFSQFLTEVKAAASTYESSSKTSSDLDAFKAVFEKYFDPDNVIDYLIISDISNNYDGIWGNNWQLFTYDGKKWWIGLYDVDGTWGNHYTGSKIVDALTGHSSGSMDMPFGYITKYYDKELKARYEELANQGIISYNHISAMLRNFTLKIGASFYDDEYSKWKDSPCASDSIVRNDYWELLLDEHGNPQTDSSESFDARTTYSVDDVVSFGLNENMGFYKFKCIKPNIALNSNTPHAISTFSPIKEFRHADNLYRLEKWVRQSLINMDELYEYTRK